MFVGGNITLKLNDNFTIQCYSTIHPLPFVTITRTVQQGALSVYSHESSFTHLLNLIKGFFMGLVYNITTICDKCITGTGPKFHNPTS